MTQWSGKTRGGVAGYRIFIFIIKYPGIRFAYGVLRLVALYFLVVSHKKPTIYYFRQILGYSRFKTFISLYKNYCLLGEMLIDKMAVMTGCKVKFSYTFEGEEYLHQMAAQGKGGLLIGAHMGNWEMAGQMLERVSATINIVMLEAEHQRIEQYLKQVLVNKQLNIIPIKEDTSHLTRIKEAFERNEMVAIHGDRFLEGASTTLVDFMGQPALFPTGPFYMATKFGVPVSYVVTVKDSRKHYHFYATPGKILPYPSRLATRKKELQLIVQEYAAVIEKRLRQYPLQWFNYYQFWEKT